MIDETTGRTERRATSVVLVVLVVETIWAFFHKYLPLDSVFWTLQSDLVREHLFGKGADGWQLTAIPSANIALPYLSGLLNPLFSGEVVTRLLQCVIGILLRGGAYLMLFRVLRVRDEAVFYIIPMVTFSGIWFSGALPYFAGETIVVFTIAYLLNQDRPRSNAYFVLSVGFLLAALFHALAFFAGLVLLIAVAREQRRTVHLSQGWLSSPRSVVGLALPGIIATALTIFSKIPPFQVSASGFLPSSGVAYLLFLCTPSPAVLEGMLRGTNVFQILIAVAVFLLIIGCLARAVLLAMEESTWQSRAIKSAGLLLLLFGVAGIWLRNFRIDTAALAGIGILLLLGGSYSRGPAQRRTMIDRLLLTVAVTAMIVAGLFNAFSINRGSQAAFEAIKRSQGLVDEEAKIAKEDEHIDSIGYALVIDSSLAAETSSGPIASFSYSITAPIYLYGRKSALANPKAFQPSNGVVSSKEPRRYSPEDMLLFGSPLDYVNPHLRVLALLPVGTNTSSQFGPFNLSLYEPAGGQFNWGAAEFNLLIGKLTNQPGKTLAAK